MAGLCEGGNELVGSLKAICKKLLKDIPPDPRRLAVASFRLDTEHDILGRDELQRYFQVSVTTVTVTIKYL
ncbi:hypothetical protein ANN_00584 [Periplaneta americana]|uniref:Uncharacterized protein n=1 Tax=Periplaneta americana TaxID=6978 RepID=A0ABQ8TRA5_PERAM|nr:hypothetical protein ANN_00584 [Periplaneta americana]